MADAPPRFLREFDTMIRARYPLLWLVTWEEQRVEALLGDLARSHGRRGETTTGTDFEGCDFSGALLLRPKPG